MMIFSRVPERLSVASLLCLVAAYGPISCGGNSDGEKATNGDSMEGESDAEGGEESNSVQDTVTVEDPATGAESSTGMTADSETDSSSNSGDSDTTGDTGDTAETAETSDTSETEESSDSAESDSASEESESEESSNTEGSESTGDESGFAVSGVFTRSVDPADGNDAEGTLYVSLLSACDAMADPIEWAIIEGASLAADGAEQAFTIEDAPNGEYFLTGYLDDNENATEDNPIPDKGDIIAAEGLAPSCVEVKIDGADVTGIKIDLNLLMPF